MSSPISADYRLFAMFVVQEPQEPVLGPCCLIACREAQQKRDKQDVGPNNPVIERVTQCKQNEAVQSCDCYIDYWRSFLSQLPSLTGQAFDIISAKLACHARGRSSPASCTVVSARQPEWGPIDAKIILNFRRHLTGDTRSQALSGGP